MKRSFAILLICIFAFNVAGFLLVFKVQQYQVRQEIKLHIKQGIPENELTRITVTPENESQLDWEDKKEFRYNGIMYDVVKKEIIDETTIIYHCVTDKQETTLFANLDELVKKNMDAKNDENDPAPNLSELLLNIYSEPQKHVWNLFQTNIGVTYEYYSGHYSSPALDITSPPPKMV